MFLLTGCQIPEKESRGIEVGMKKIQVRKLLLPAAVTTTFVKQTEHIWGPQEVGWDQVEWETPGKTGSTSIRKKELCTFTS